MYLNYIGSYVVQAPLPKVSCESDAVAQALPAAKLGENFSKYSSLLIGKIIKRL